MDENSREGQTSVDGELPKDASIFLQPADASEPPLDFGTGPSLDASGPSRPVPPPVYGEEAGGQSPEECSPVPSYEERQGYQHHVRMAPDVEDPSRKRTVGPPPSYSFVMKQKKKTPKPSGVSETMATSRSPPPTYGGSRGLYVTPEESRLERVCTFPSFAEPIWRSHSQPALCPRCGIFVLTTTHSHDSVATHVAALALCLFGCWPCCLLPYCMNVCKNTYHHCPICQSFLGIYTPW